MEKVETLGRNIKNYQKQLEQSTIQKTYKGLMEYIMKLRTHFMNKYPDYFVAGNIHQGYMDITYFTFTPKTLKIKKIKIAIVLNHSKMQFEIYLVGQNKQIQKRYWQLLKDSGWDKYSMPVTPQDAIVEAMLVENPDFDQLDSLTLQIETGTMKFIEEITRVLEK